MTTDTAREQYSRTRLLLGQQGIDRLRAARVAVFGVGGVGGYVVEALARSGVGALDLIDDDKVCLSNLNRQIIATHSTLGQYKVDAAAARVRDIDRISRCAPTRSFTPPRRRISSIFPSTAMWWTPSTR